MPARHRARTARKHEPAEDAEKKARDEEIEVLYGRLLKDFRELKPSRRSKHSYGEIALAALENLKNARRAVGAVPSSFPEGVGLKVGQVAPEIQGLDARGMPMKLADFRGKVVVLDFWGDW